MLRHGQSRLRSGGGLQVWRVFRLACLFGAAAEGHRSPAVAYKRTKTWLILPEEYRPPEPVAQLIIGRARQRAVASFLSITCLSLAGSLASLSLASHRAVAAPAGAAAPAPRAAMVTRPAVQPVFQHNRPHMSGTRPQLGYPYPATFKPTATWPQRPFRLPAKGGVVAPQVIVAPVEAGGAPGPYAVPVQPDFELPIQEAVETPCTAPLVIRIGNAAPQACNVRVNYGATSECATPQVVRYHGPRIVEENPGAGPRRVQRSARKGAKIIAVKPAVRW
jgi:hypothetical protein